MVRDAWVTVVENLRWPWGELTEPDWFRIEHLRQPHVQAAVAGARGSDRECHADTRFRANSACRRSD